MEQLKAEFPADRPSESLYLGTVAIEMAFDLRHLTPMVQPGSNSHLKRDVVDVV